MRDRPDFQPKLTERQQQILELIQRSISHTGAPPTRAEIAAELGFKSANAAEEHLQALARKGAIELISGTSRGIRLKSDALRAIHAAKWPPASLASEADWSPLSRTVALPLVGRVSAGLPMLAQQHIEQTFQFNSGLFQGKPDYLLKVRGMSMQGAGILDGDFLAVKITQEVKNGQIVVARLGDDVTVKRFWRCAQHIELRPENPAFSTLVLSGNEALVIEGLAVGLIRNTPLM